MIGLAVVCALPFVVVLILIKVDPGKLRPTTPAAPAPVEIDVDAILAPYVDPAELRAVVTVPEAPVVTGDPFAGHPMHCKCYHHR